MAERDERGPVPELRTGRLLLRAWRAADREPFAAMNADPEVMEHYPSTLSRSASDALVARIERTWAAGAPSLWAVEVPGDAPFIGYVGLLEATFEADFTPCVEVGWRLARPFWGRGYATEAATAALDHGFDVVGLAEVHSFTAVGNQRSRRVMERLGLRRDPADDFEHPALPRGHRLRRHVRYRIDAATWRARRGVRGTAGHAADPGDELRRTPSTPK
jgi:RimJ/RimL family protein N-acetyltransferase